MWRIVALKESVSQDNPKYLFMFYTEHIESHFKTKALKKQRMFVDAETVNTQT